MTPHLFAQKWKASQLKERSASQEHFLDLCRLIGQPTPAESDPDGNWCTFERGVRKTGGGEGWADVWKKGYFAWEYKGKHKDLTAAGGGVGEGGNIASAARKLDQLRNTWLNPPEWVDWVRTPEEEQAVAAAYGWEDYPPEMPDEEILRRLLVLNLARSRQARHNHAEDISIHQPCTTSYSS